MMDKIITYFKTLRPHNTAETLRAAKKRAEELEIKDVIIASTHGATGLLAAEMFQEMRANIIVVSIVKDVRAQS